MEQREKNALGRLMIFGLCIGFFFVGDEICKNSETFIDIYSLTSLIVFLFCIAFLSLFSKYLGLLTTSIFLGLVIGVVGRVCIEVRFSFVFPVAFATIFTLMYILYLRISGPVCSENVEESENSEG